MLVPVEQAATYKGSADACCARLMPPTGTTLRARTARAALPGPDGGHLHGGEVPTPAVRGRCHQRAPLSERGRLGQHFLSPDGGHLHGGEVPTLWVRGRCRLSRRSFDPMV